MHKLGVSIVVCCYNSKERIEKTLIGLKSQNITTDKVEIILVDNNSKDNTVEYSKKLWDSFNSSIRLKIISEGQQGLSYARRAGVSNALFKYIIFCDDDNYLIQDYAKNALKIMENDSSIGALCGKNIAVFEKGTEEWIKEFKEAYACGYDNRNSGYMEGRQVPWGAGIVLRKSFLDRMEAINFESLLSDRKGKELSSGGDTEICYLLKLCGYKWRYDTRLQLEHFIPINRCNYDYLERLYFGFGKANAIIENYYKHGHIERFNGSIPYWWKVYLRQKILFYNKRNSTNSIEENLNLEFRKGFLKQLWNEKFRFRNKQKLIRNTITLLNQ